MRVHLMYRDRDFDPKQELPWNTGALIQDLELDTLLRGMAGDDAFLFDVARTALLSGLQHDVDTVRYRQEILQDCLRNPTVSRELYRLTVETIGRKGNRWLGIFSRYPAGILSDAIHLLELLVDGLTLLRNTAKAHAHRFTSEGFSTLFAMLEQELSDDYLTSIRTQLMELQFPRGVFLSADLGEGNSGVNYVLRLAPEKPSNWLQRMLGRGQPPAYTFRLDPRDEAGAQILSDMKANGINAVANALAQSADHVMSFFTMLRTELAFYVSCLNLHERLAGKGEPTCFPHPVHAGERRYRFSELYDVCLSLLMGGQRVVGNTVDADGKNLVLITGANQGGKSVFLRSIGLAQLMMHSGMFVAAESFAAEVCTGVFTHYKREEDATMRGGKLDEELARMSEIVDHITPNALLLCNESFAATNDREGSEITRQIVNALLESGIKVIFVTHLYEFAHGLSNQENVNTLLLRAERGADGTRPFRLVEGKPLETSYGEDVYREVFSVGTANHAPDDLNRQLGEQP